MGFLPTMPVSTFEIDLYSVGKKKFRRMRVADEKLLLIAKQSEDDNDVFNAVKQVVENTSQSADLDVDALPIFDLEYAFLKLYAASMNNNVNIQIKDPEEDNERKFVIDLNTINITPEKTSSDLFKMVKVSDTIGIKLIYPPAKLYGDKDIAVAKDPTFEVALRCVSAIYDGDSVYEFKTPEQVKELREWLNQLEGKIYKEIREFFENLPSLYYAITYTTESGKERKIEFRTLNDFFML